MTYDGWHNIYQYTVWTENNMVLYCYYRDTWDEQIPAKPFRWDNKAKKWVDVTGKCTLNALYSGLKRDTYAIL